MMYSKTCGLENPIDRSVCFASNMDWVQIAVDSGLRLEVFYPHDLSVPETKNINWIPCHNPLFEFIRCHNTLNQHRSPMENVISETAEISPNASIGDDGLRYARSNGRLIGMKHMGNVVIENKVVVGAFTSIARGTFGSTLIDEQTKIDRGVYISHNCYVGKRCLIVQGASLMGSVSIGSDCFIGGGAIIRNGIWIAKGNMIGMGAVVTSPIHSSGYCYVGNPAKPLRPWNGELI